MNWLYNIVRKTPIPPFDSSFSKVCLVTGATSGIGLETARLMYSRGYNVVLACRNLEKADEVKSEFEQIEFPTPSRKPLVKVIDMDLNDLDKVADGCKEFGNNFDRLDVLINSAGIWNGKSNENKEGITKHGFSVTYQTSHLAHFYLTRLLLPYIVNSSKITNSPGRIINVSSGLHTKVMNEITKKSDSLSDLDWEKRMVTEHGDDFSSQTFQYMFVKLLNVMYAKQFARLHSDKEVLSFSCHPGPIATNFYREWPRWLQVTLNLMAIPPVYGAFTSCYLATSQDSIVLNNNGNYFDNCQLQEHHKLADNLDQCKLLWEKSEDQLNSLHTSKTEKTSTL